MSRRPFSCVLILQCVMNEESPMAWIQLKRIPVMLICVPGEFTARLRAFQR